VVNVSKQFPDNDAELSIAAPCKSEPPWARPGHGPSLKQYGGKRMWNLENVAMQLLLHVRVRPGSALVLSIHETLNASMWKQPELLEAHVPHFST
jgi:hypothetical protein